VTYQKLFGLVVQKVDPVGNIDPLRRDHRALYLHQGNDRYLVGLRVKDQRKSIPNLRQRDFFRVPREGLHVLAKTFDLSTVLGISHSY
jgi:hypothetical protein